MLHLTLEDQLFLGQPKQVGTHSTVHDHLAVMFEDDGETGYFYALDMRQNAQPVVDCLHVYNADNTRNHHEARKLEILLLNKVSPTISSNHKLSHIIWIRKVTFFRWELIIKSDLMITKITEYIRCFS